METKFTSLAPRHEVRVIKGFFDDLIKGESEDFLMAELLDEGPVIDAMARLRQKYPRMMTIQSHRRMNSGSGERSFDLMKRWILWICSAFFIRNSRIKNLRKKRKTT